MDNINECIKEIEESIKKHRLTNIEVQSMLDYMRHTLIHKALRIGDDF